MSENIIIKKSLGDYENTAETIINFSDFRVKKSEFKRFYDMIRYILNSSKSNNFRIDIKIRAGSEE